MFWMWWLISCPMERDAGLRSGPNLAIKVLAASTPTKTVALPPQ